MDEYADDPSIHDTAILWRRIPPRWLVLDERKGGIRASSAAFDDSQDGTPMSVVLCDVMEANGCTSRDALMGLEGYALAGISAGLVRSYDLGVARDPLPDAPAHAVVVGRKTKSVRRKLANASYWVIQPSLGDIRGPDSVVK